MSGSTTANYNREWASLRGKWQLFNVLVRARLLSVDPEWLPAAAETKFVYRLDERLSPLCPVVVAIANQLLPFMNAVKSRARKRIRGTTCKVSHRTQCAWLQA